MRSGRSSTMSCFGIGEAEQPVEADDVGIRGVELLGEEAQQILGHAAVDVEPDDIAAPAALQRRLVEADEVLGLLLDLDLAVPDDAELALADDVEAGEELIEEEPEHLLQRQEADRLAGQADEAVRSSTG